MQLVMLSHPVGQGALHSSFHGKTLLAINGK